jgi:hypothetical protein
LKAHVRAADSLAARILELLYQPQMGQRLREKGVQAKYIRHFSWDELRNKPWLSIRKSRVQYAKSVWSRH